MNAILLWSLDTLSKALVCTGQLSGKLISLSSWGFTTISMRNCSSISNKTTKFQLPQFDAHVWCTNVLAAPSVRTISNVPLFFALSISKRFKLRPPIAWKRPNVTFAIVKLIISTEMHLETIFESFSFDPLPKSGKLSK